MCAREVCIGVSRLGVDASTDNLSIHCSCRDCCSEVSISVMELSSTTLKICLSDPFASWSGSESSSAW